MTQSATPPLPSKSKVLSNKAYVALRSAIVSGKLTAGTQLVIRELIESLNMSSTPIKSALTTLESEGLVISKPYKGFFVPSFDANDVFEIYSLREALERKTVRLAALNIDASIIAELRKILDQQKVFSETGDVEGHVDMDITFHLLIAKASRNQRLVDMVKSILGQAHLVMASSARGFRKLQDIQKEHRKIIEGLEHNNPDLAELAMLEHNQAAIANLIKHYPEAKKLDFNIALQENLLLTETLSQQIYSLNKNDQQAKEAQLAKQQVFNSLSSYLTSMSEDMHNSITQQNQAVNQLLEQMADAMGNATELAMLNAELEKLTKKFPTHTKTKD